MCFFSGKTYLLNAILRKVRSWGKVALATAFSGIAATLLDNGRTLHSRFKLPLTFDDSSTGKISPGSDLNKLLCRANLLIVDEVTMANKLLFECVDR